MGSSNLAEKFEASSVDQKPALTAISGGAAAVSDPLDEVTLRKTKRQHIREFGAVIGLALAVIAAIKLYRSGNLNTVLTLAGVSALFALLCAWAPRMMNPAFVGWMKFAKVLEVVMTRVLLGLMWFATFFPIGILFRILGKNTLARGFEPNRPSYWENCEESRKDFALLERQY